MSVQTESFSISKEYISEQNEKSINVLKEDFEHLGNVLSRENVDIENITKKAQDFAVAIPSWGVGTGGTRFARFAGRGEPRNIIEKLEDCGAIHQLSKITPTVSLHIPWDKPESARNLKKVAKSFGLSFDAMNSNTFQDNEPLSYKFGSLAHTSKETRQQAVEHNMECIEIGLELGSKALTVWIGDGANFPGQQNFREALERYMESARQIYSALPDNWQMFVEHKPFEPAFYASIISDWGTSFWVVNELGPKASSLVDLGHHLPNTNIELIVSRLAQFGKLGGFHFNDSKYGDDDLDSGSLNPYQLFLIFNELVDAESKNLFQKELSYMLDQSHNITDPIESLITSAIEVQRAYLKALLIDRLSLEFAQKDNDPMRAMEILKKAFNIDVSCIQRMARYRNGGAITPVDTYRSIDYRGAKESERPVSKSTSSGIV